MVGAPMRGPTNFSLSSSLILHMATEQCAVKEGHGQPRILGHSYNTAPRWGSAQSRPYDCLGTSGQGSNLPKELAKSLHTYKSTGSSSFGSWFLSLGHILFPGYQAVHSIDSPSQPPSHHGPRRAACVSLLLTTYVEIISPMSRTLAGYKTPAGLASLSSSGSRNDISMSFCRKQ